MPRKFDPEPVCCGICKREAAGIGYAPKQGKPVLWLCESPECIPLGRVAFHMNPDRLSHHESIALTEAGAAGGAYLESIGKLSLAELNELEWNTFLETVLREYGNKMRERLLSHAAPF